MYTHDFTLKFGECVDPLWRVHSTPSEEYMVPRLALSIVKYKQSKSQLFYFPLKYTSGFFVPIFYLILLPSCLYLFIVFQWLDQDWFSQIHQTPQRSTERTWQGIMSVYRINHYLSFLTFVEPVLGNSSSGTKIAWYKTYIKFLSVFKNSKT